MSKSNNLLMIEKIQLSYDNESNTPKTLSKDRQRTPPDQMRSKGPRERTKISYHCVNQSQIDKFFQNKFSLKD